MAEAEEVVEDEADRADGDRREQGKQPARMEGEGPGAIPREREEHDQEADRDRIGRPRPGARASATPAAKAQCARRPPV